MAQEKEIKVHNKNSFIFDFSFISWRKYTANNAFTTQQSSAIGYAFHIHIFKTAIIAKKFHTHHINQDNIIGIHILTFS